MKRLLSILIVMLLMGLGAEALYAQAGTDTSKGSVAVEVLDATGAVIQNARITLSGPTGSQKATSDVRGQAVFYSLIAGVYSVKVEFEGFRTSDLQNINVSANQRSTLQARMEPGSVTETVQVTESAAKIDTTTTTTGANITEETIANLPVARNITALFTLAPGAASSGGINGPGDANPSISGASGLENQYIIDGINATDQGYGAFGVYSNVYGSLGTGVNFDFVKEVQVKSGGFEAQYGQALGGVVNIVTHSGTNNFHGAIYAYTSPNFAQGTYRQVNDNRVARPITETHGRGAYDFGFNAGGPLVKNRLFWYGSFNPSFSTRHRMAPKGFALRDQGLIDWKSRSYNWVGKLSFEINPNHHLEGTAFSDPSRDPSGLHHDLLRDDSLSGSSAVYGTRNWAVKYNGLYGPKTLLNAQFAWNRTYFDETIESNLYGVRNYAKPTLGSLFTNQGGVGLIENSQGDNRQYSVMLTRNVEALGGHQIDLGYGYNQILYDADRYYSGPNWIQMAGPGVNPEHVGKTVYGGLFRFYATRTIGGVGYENVYRLYRGNFSAPSVETDSRYQNAFLQDAWQLNRYLTAKLGVRWEQQALMGANNSYTFVGNWAPRLGLIIDPTGNRKTKIFANWGRFFEKIPQDIAVRAMSLEQAYNGEYMFGLPPTAENLVPGTTFTPYGSTTTINPGTKAQFQEEIVLGAEHEFEGGVLLSARFIHRNLKRILEDISGATVESANAGTDQNFVISNPNMKLDIFHNPVACTGGDNCNPDTGFIYGSGALGSDGVPDTFPDPRRVYKALELTAEKRFAHNWSVMGTYRLAKLFGNYEGLFRNDNGQSDPNITSLFDFMYSPALGDQFKVGVLPTDRRHQANLTANYLFAGKLNVGMRWNMTTGAPLSKLLAHPAYLNAGEVPVGGRGALGRTPVQNYTDLRVDYRIPLQGDTTKIRLSADLFNLFNQKTTTDIDQWADLDLGTSNLDFKKAQGAHDPFSARFSVRFEF